MKQDVLTSVEGLTIFPVIGLIIFVVFFAFVIYHVMKLPKDKVDEINKLPLDE